MPDQHSTYGSNCILPTNTADFIVCLYVCNIIGYKDVPFYSRIHICIFGVLNNWFTSFVFVINTSLSI